MPCGVILYARMGPRPPAAALIKQNDPVVIGVEIAPHRRAASAPGSAMQYDHWLAVRVAALLHINAVPLADRHDTLIKRVNPRIKMRHMTTTVDPGEIAKFEAMAAEWWDVNGKFKPLHMLNPCRLDYITTQIAAEFDRDLKTRAPFKGLRILDIA